MPDPAVLFRSVPKIRHLKWEVRSKHGQMQFPAVLNILRHAQGCACRRNTVYSNAGWNSLHHRRAAVIKAVLCLSL